MAKCEFCGEEVLFPFECSFCSGKFCRDHRLPENHLCLKSPPRTPLGHWKAKKKPFVKYPTVKLPKLIAKESQLAHAEKTRRKSTHTLSQKIATIIIGSLISIGGFAIVLWEIYNPWFWTVFFIWFIPIPLILIGIGILIFGLLIAIAGAF